jgi:carboxyl-terminal processing protease
VIDRLQPVISKYPTADNFIGQYNISEDSLHNFIAYASQTVKYINPRDLQQSRDIIKTLIKANAARFKWGNNAYYRVLNDSDTTFKKALRE